MAFKINLKFRLETTEMSWQDGADFCENDGGYLASILSGGEEWWLSQTFNLATLGKHINIGFTDAAQEGKGTTTYQMKQLYKIVSPPE